MMYSDITMEVSVNFISRQNGSANNMRLSEQIDVHNMNLAEMAAIMAKFHDVIEEINRSKKERK